MLSGFTTNVALPFASVVTTVVASESTYLLPLFPGVSDSRVMTAFWFAAGFPAASFTDTRNTALVPASTVFSCPGSALVRDTSIFPSVTTGAVGVSLGASDGTVLGVSEGAADGVVSAFLTVTATVAL